MLGLLLVHVPQISVNLLSSKFREIRTSSRLFLFNMAYSCNFTHILLYHLAMPRHIKEC